MGLNGSADILVKYQYGKKRKIFHFINTKSTMALDLTKYGITGSTVIAHNPSYEELYKAEINPALEGYEKGKETELGAVNVMTGIFTGRSPKDKYIVDNDESHNNVWWTSEEYKNDNHPMSEDVWAKVKEIAIKSLTTMRATTTYGGLLRSTRTITTP